MKMLEEVNTRIRVSYSEKSFVSLSLELLAVVILGRAMLGLKKSLEIMNLNKRCFSTTMNLNFLDEC